MLELFDALSRMLDVAQNYTRSKKSKQRSGSISFFEVRLVEGLRLSYMQLQRDPEAAHRVYAMYRNVEHFQSAHARALDYLHKNRELGGSDPQSVRYGKLCHLAMRRGVEWVTRCRYKGMHMDFQALVESYKRFCVEKGIEAQLGNLDLKEPEFPTFHIEEDAEGKSLEIVDDGMDYGDVLAS